MKRRKSIKKDIKAEKIDSFPKLKMKRMKRKSPIKMKKIDFKNNKIIKHFWGGHLPYPPEDCIKSEFIFKHINTKWIDLSICHSCENIPLCSRRKEYLANRKKGILS